MNMKRLLTMTILLTSTIWSKAQQVNPVPDYVFRNQMSVGRGTVTDTAAYFSIGPRYGAVKGFMPPIVVDTATFSSGKRNGLLIFSVQKNKFLYWDSVRVQWSDMAGSSGAYIVAGDTSAMLAPYLRKADTTAMLLPYVRHAGYGLTKSGQSFLVDTLNISTRAWRQKGLDSLAALEVSGSGTTNYVPKFTDASTIGNSIAFDNNGEFLINTTTDAGDYKLQVSGDIYNTGRAILAASSGIVGIGTTSPNTNYKLTIGGGDMLIRSLRIGTGLLDASSNTAFGFNALGSTTSASSTTGIGNSALQNVTSGIRNTAVGSDAGSSVTTSNLNSFFGYNSGNKTTTGGENVALGGASLFNNVTGSRNVAIGAAALNGSLRDNNVAIGQNAGRWVAPGTTQEADSITNGLYIGYEPKAGSKTATNEIVIGNNANGNGSNTVTIGNSSTTQNYFFGSIRTSAPAGGTIQPWRLGEAATVSPTSPNRTIRVEIDGTVYYIHAKTTND